MTLIANIAQIFLWLGLGAGAQASSPCVALQRPSDRTGCVSGTLFDPKGAVIVGKVVVLTNVLTGHATKASVDVRGQYHVEVAEGIYELRFENASDLLPYKRARFRVLAAVQSIVNLYPVQRTGFAMTVQGDVPLPDPQVSYDTFQPKGPASSSGLNLVIQYGKRTSLNGTTTYEGRQVMATFDE